VVPVKEEQMFNVAFEGFDGAQLFVKLDVTFGRCVESCELFVDLD
jgi:hypothetical protein